MIPFQPKSVLDDKVGFCVGRIFFFLRLSWIRVPEIAEEDQLSVHCKQVIFPTNV